MRVVLVSALLAALALSAWPSPGDRFVGTWTDGNGDYIEIAPTEQEDTYQMTWLQTVSDVDLPTQYSLRLEGDRLMFYPEDNWTGWTAYIVERGKLLVYEAGDGEVDQVLRRTRQPA